MTTERLKNEIDAAVGTLEALDQSVPGGAAVNRAAETLRRVLERPIILAIVAAALTAEGL